MKTFRMLAGTAMLFLLAVGSASAIYTAQGDPKLRPIPSAPGIYGLGCNPSTNVCWTGPNFPMCPGDVIFVTGLGNATVEAVYSQGNEDQPELLDALISTNEE